MERERDQTKISQLVNDYETLKKLAETGAIDMSARSGQKLPPLEEAHKDRFVFSKWHFTEKEYFEYGIFITCFTCHQ